MSPYLAVALRGGCRVNLTTTGDKNMIDPKEFIYAGNAIFTLKSLRTGEHFTYKFTKKDTVYFASVLNGPDNWTNYAYLGLTSPDTLGLRLTAKSRAGDDAPSVRALRWWLSTLRAQRNVDDLVEFKHEGKCCRCGRKLTHPESIDSGIGPECASKI